MIIDTSKLVSQDSKLVGEALNKLEQMLNELNNEVKIIEAQKG